MDPFQINALMYRARHLSKKRDIWRFRFGSSVYVYGWCQDQPAIIEDRVTEALWPQYVVKEHNGDRWVISQLLLSSRPIPLRSELVEADD